MSEAENNSVMSHFVTNCSSRLEPVGFPIWHIFLIEASWVWNDSMQLFFKLFSILQGNWPSFKECILGYNCWVHLEFHVNVQIQFNVKRYPLFIDLIETKHICYLIITIHIWVIMFDNFLSKPSPAAAIIIEVKGKIVWQPNLGHFYHPSLVNWSSVCRKVEWIFSPPKIWTSFFPAADHCSK